MSRLCQAFLPVVLLLLSLTERKSSAAPVEFTAETAKHLDKWTEDLLGCLQVTGLGITVAQRGTTVYSKTRGVANLEQNVTFTSTTMMNVASLSKAFTSILLEMVAQENKLSLDTPLSSLPGGEVMKFRDIHRTQLATIDDLLSHRMGWPRYDLLWVALAVTDQELPKHVRHMEMPQSFRSSYLYNNLAYSLASVLAESVTQRPLAQLMREKIYTPLNMSQSGLLNEANFSTLPLLLPTWRHENGSVLNVDPAVVRIGQYAPGAAGMLTNMEDMEKWTAFLTRMNPKIRLRQGSDANLVQLVSALRRSVEPRNAYVFNTDFDVPSLTFESYARGWMRSYFQGRLVMSHGGSMFGIESGLVWSLDSSTSVFVIVALQLGHPDPTWQFYVSSMPLRLAFAVLGYLLDGSSWLLNSNISVCERVENDLSSFINATQARASMSPNNSSLTADLEGQQSASAPATDDRFFRDFSDEEVVFLVGSYENQALGNLSLNLLSTNNATEYSPRRRRVVAYYGKLWREEVFALRKPCELPLGYSNSTYLRDSQRYQVVGFVSKVVGVYQFLQPFENVTWRYCTFLAVKDKSSFRSWDEPRESLLYFYLFDSVVLHFVKNLAIVPTPLPHIALVAPALLALIAFRSQFLLLFL